MVIYARVMNENNKGRFVEWKVKEPNTEFWQC